MAYSRTGWVIALALAGAFSFPARAFADPQAVPGVLVELLGARDAGGHPYSPQDRWVEESASTLPRLLSLHRKNIDRIEVSVGSTIYRSHAHEMERISIHSYRHGATTIRARLGPVTAPGSTAAGQPVEVAAIDFAGGRHLLFSGEAGAIRAIPVGQRVTLTIDAFARRLHNFKPRSRVFQDLSHRGAMQLAVDDLRLQLQINADWPSEVEPILRQTMESDLVFALRLANTEAMQAGPVSDALVVTASTFTPPPEIRKSVEWRDMTVDEIAQVIAANQGRQAVIHKLDEHPVFDIDQNDETDFAFLDRLARKDGWRLYLAPGKLHLEDRERFPRPPAPRNHRFGRARRSDVMKGVVSRCEIVLEVAPSARMVPITQSGESDPAFLQRLAAEENLTLRAGNAGRLLALPALSFSRGEQLLRTIDIRFGPSSYSHSFASSCAQIANPLETAAELVELTVPGRKVARSRKPPSVIQPRPAAAPLATSPPATAEATARVERLLREVETVLSTQSPNSTRRHRLLLAWSRELQAGIVARFAQASNSNARLDELLERVRPPSATVRPPPPSRSFKRNIRKRGTETAPAADGAVEGTAD